MASPHSTHAKHQTQMGDLEHSSFDKMGDDWTEILLEWEQKKAVLLEEEKNTFLVPGTCFELEGFLRIGFGNNTKILKAGLVQLTEFLDELR